MSWTRVLVWSLLGWGCSGDDAKTDPVDTSGPVDTDTETGGSDAQVTVAPPPGFVDVAPLVDVVGSYDADLEEASLADVTASLVDEFGRAVRVAVRLRGRDVVVDPVVPLEFGLDYVLDLSGLRLIDGSSAPAFTTQFTVHPEPGVTRTESYSPGPLPSNDLFSLRVSEYDEAGNLLRQLTYAGPGDDGLWNTPDDEIGSRSEVTYDGLGRRFRSTSFGDAGDDGMWGTKDDIATRFTEHVYEVDEERVFTNDAGPDGQAGTADDVALFGTVFRNDGTTFTAVSSSGPGDDGIWGTSDDPDVTGRSDVLDLFGNTVRNVRHAGPGDDGIFFTSDDAIDSYSERPHDDQGNWLGTERYVEPGLDGIWFTPDDEPSQLVTNTYDSDGQRQLQVNANGPGLDGQWGTPDDALQDFIRYEYTSDGVLLREVELQPGPDGAVDGGDDVVESYEAFTSDADGFVSEERFVVDAGEDGTWFGPDDAVFVRTVFDEPRTASLPN